MDYARAIQEINITRTLFSFDATIAEITYFRLAQLQSASNPLFPALSHLSIDDSASKSYFYIPMFLSPELMSVSLTGLDTPGRASAATSFLSMLGSRNNLTRLSLRSLPLSPTALAAIVGCGGLSRLELTSVGGTINQPSLHALFSMPSLTDITFHTKTLKYSASDSVNALLPGSTRLSSLRLTGPFEMLSEWTKYFSSGGCNLQTLSLELTRTIVNTGKPSNGKNSKGKPVNSKPSSTQYARTDPAAIDTLIKEAVPAWRQSLSTFEVVLDPHIEDALPPTFLDAIAGFSHLQGLVLKGIALHDLNRSLQRLVSHWPSLTHLHLPMVNVDNVDCTVSVDTLRHLAENCPRLTVLRLLMQNPEDDYCSTIASAINGVHFPHVHTLSTGTWKMSDHQSTGGSIWESPSQSSQSNEPATLSVKHFCSIVRNIMKVFPRLRTLEPCKGLSERVWSDIQALVELCRETEENSKVLSN